MSVPDWDVPGWMRVLHENGFSTEEIDEIMMHLNDTYFFQKTTARMRDLLSGRVKAKPSNNKLTPEEIESLKGLLDKKPE